MPGTDFALFALEIAVMLAVAVLCGYVAQRMGQPAILGEMVGGILLGPTLLGAVAPLFYARLFPPDGPVIVARYAVITLGMLFFLFIAGQEVNLADLRSMGWRPAVIGFVGTIVPIFAGVALVYAMPRSFWGPSVQQHFLAFGLFIGMCLANSANPVLARILMDLGLMNQPIGSMLMTATIVDDLVNWTLFAIILSDIAPSGVTQSVGLAGALTVVALFFVAVLGVGRWAGPRAMAWMRPHLSWPAGFIAATSFVILVTSAAAEWLGLNAFLGAFLAGVALSGEETGHEADHIANHGANHSADHSAIHGANHADTPSADHDAVGGHAAPGEIIRHFALSFFAPIYFVSIGLTANFVRDFDLALFVVILSAALVSKFGSVLLGVRLAGMPLDRSALAIAFGLNARGATGIILAGIGLAHAVIDDRLFVAIVLMCLVTTLIAAPAMQALTSKPASVTPSA